MEFWIRSDGADTWKVMEGHLQALDLLCRHPDHRGAVVTLDPVRDLEELAAFLRLSDRCEAPPGRITVLTPHPTARWLRSLVDAGFGEIGLAVADRPTFEAPPDSTLEDQLERTCPQLHVARHRGRVLSVCGTHEDRMVLSSRHVDSWCLHADRPCPYMPTLEREAEPHAD